MIDIKRYLYILCFKRGNIFHVVRRNNQKTKKTISIYF